MALRMAEPPGSGGKPSSTSWKVLCTRANLSSQVYLRSANRSSDLRLTSWPELLLFLRGYRVSKFPPYTRHVSFKR